MKKFIKENFKYIYLMSSMLIMIILFLDNKFVEAVVTGIFAIEYVKAKMLLELSEHLKTSVIFVYKKGDEAE